MRTNLLVPLATATVALFFGMANTALAAPVGTLNIANCSGGGVTVTATTITWLPAGTLPGTGCIDTGAGTSVAYSGGTLLPGVIGNILDLTFSPGSKDMFMTFPAPPLPPPGLDFVLTSVGPGDPNTNCNLVASPGSPQTCSVFTGSPFILSFVSPTRTAISLAVGGTVADANGTSSWIGVFTTQLDKSGSTIQSDINGGGSETTTHSASFILTAVPEPGTVSILGTGLLLVGLAVFRRRSFGARG
jgi:hypothetical protein